LTRSRHCQDDLGYDKLSFSAVARFTPTPDI
jgi:hypothetical protein